MWYFKVDFGEAFIRECGEDEFIHHPHNAHHWSQPGFEITDKERKRRLRELWRLVNGKKDDSQRSIAKIGEAGPPIRGGE